MLSNPWARISAAAASRMRPSASGSRGRPRLRRTGTGSGATPGGSPAGLVIVTSRGYGANRALRRVLAMSVVHAPVTRITSDVTRPKHAGMDAETPPDHSSGNEAGLGPTTQQSSAPAVPLTTGSDQWEVP